MQLLDMARGRCAQSNGRRLCHPSHFIPVFIQLSTPPLLLLLLLLASIIQMHGDEIAVERATATGFVARLMRNINSDSPGNGVCGFC